jgi:phage tail sheath protein FI
MANVNSSPGVSLNELDQSFTSPLPVKVGAAIIGPTTKGPVELPTVVTSYSDYKNVFGGSLISGSDSYSYLTSIAAFNYFNSGGTSLLVTRVASGSFTPAELDVVISGGYIVNDYVEDGYVPTDIVATLETISEGVIMNSSGSVDVNGVLENGTKDNLRIEITNPSTASGTFNVIVRRGDDKASNKIILETFNKVSLDPLSSNYIARVIGDEKHTYSSVNNQVETTGNYPNASKYIRVKEVVLTTPNYLDANGLPNPAYTGSIPVLQNNAFGDATGNIMGGANFYENIGAQTQGVVAADYTNMVNLLSNDQDYKFNVLLTPGLVDQHHASVINNIIVNTQQRGDNIYVPDMVAHGSTRTAAITQAQSKNSSYAATYWPWVRMQDPETGKLVWVPASTVIGGVYAFNDRVKAPWFAPAGLNRGGLNTVQKAEYKLSKLSQNELYDDNINPVSTQGNQVVITGQKTLQKEASALDRVNVRRLLIELKSYIGQVADTLVFEQNTLTTQNKFLTTVNPYLERIKQKEGLYAFKVVMDDTNNTPDVVDRNQLVGQIFIQPTKTAEFINLDFVIQPTGASFPV